MWLCHVTRRNVIVMLHLLCFLPEQMIHIRAHYVCEVGQEKDREGIWRWVLPYQHPCKCTSIRYGGMNTITPKGPFEPVYVNKPLVGDNMKKIIQHYNLDCTDPLFETCPADLEIPTDMGKPTGIVKYTTPPASDNSGYVSVLCEPPSGSDMRIGQNMIRCEALDSSQNSAICEFQVVVRDVENPLYTKCPENFQVLTDPGNSTAVVPYHQLIARDNSGEVTVTCDPPSESKFAIGQTNVTCTARDGSGNTATCRFEVDVKDEEDPVISPCPGSGNLLVPTDPGNTTTVVSFHATDNSGQVTLSCDPPSESVFAIGETNVICTAQDGSGNNATCKFEVEVRDEEDPLISACPEDLEKQTDSGKPTAVVTYHKPTATDNSVEVPIVTCTPLFELEFGMGPTNVTCTARDDSGNTATCGFSVIIKDEEQPLFSACLDLNTTTDPGKHTAVVTYQQPTATDNSGEVMIVTCAPLSESEFAIGPTMVTCTTQDDSGNIATCEFTVNVKDEEKPMFSACLDFNTNTDSGNPTAVDTYQQLTATDNSGEGMIVTCAPLSESEFAIGPTMVTCTTQDDSRNTATCEFTVNVKDEEDPVISQCSESGKVQVPTDPGNSTAVVSFQATDNSGQVTLSCDPPSETEFEMGQTDVKCTAQDGSENTATCRFEVDVRDEEPPVISECYANYDFQAEPGSSTAIVTYQLPPASDNSRQHVILSCDPPSGSEFATGTTDVECTATDSSGNNATSTCEFQVYIRDNCRERLGVEDERITDNQLTASTEYRVYYGARNARLNRKAKYDKDSGVRSIGAWRADINNDPNPWIQASLGGQKWVIGVLLQGREDCCKQNSQWNGQWVTKFKVEYYSGDITSGIASWDYVQQANSHSEMIFDGSTDQNTVTTSIFHAPVNASIIRIRPTAWEGRACLRFELLGCELTQLDDAASIKDQVSCRERLGVEDGSLTDDQLAASTEYQHANYGASNGRLNRVTSRAWIAQEKNSQQWIQAALEIPHWLTGVLLQGRDCNCQQWVTRFKVEYSVDGEIWSYVQQEDNNAETIFDGNTNQNSVVTRFFQTPVKASFIRIRPTSWNGWISLRFELLGCEEQMICKTGWPVVNHPNVNVDSNGWTMVSPDKTLCSGQVTTWTYLGKQAHPFRAIVFRPISGSVTKFQIIGINNIPAGAVDVSITYSVPEAERITVEEGDVIGWSFGDGVIAPVIAFVNGGTVRVRWRAGNTGLKAGQMLDFNGAEPRQYSIEATVEVYD